MLLTMTKRTVEGRVISRLYPTSDRYQQWDDAEEQLRQWGVSFSSGQVSDDAGEYVELNFSDLADYRDMRYGLKAAMHLNDILGRADDAGLYEAFVDDFPDRPAKKRTGDAFGG
jgi:hypothetical protein